MVEGEEIVVEDEDDGSDEKKNRKGNLKPEEKRDWEMKGGEKIINGVVIRNSGDGSITTAHAHSSHYSNGSHSPSKTDRTLVQVTASPTNYPQAAVSPKAAEKSSSSFSRQTSVVCEAERFEV